MFLPDRDVASAASLNNQCDSFASSATFTGTVMQGRPIIDVNVNIKIDIKHFENIKIVKNWNWERIRRSRCCSHPRRPIGPKINLAGSAKSLSHVFSN